MLCSSGLSVIVDLVQSSPLLSIGSFQCGNSSELSLSSLEKMNYHVIGQKTPSLSRLLFLATQFERISFPF
jgi:hypothetical protein